MGQRKGRGVKLQSSCFLIGVYFRSKQMFVHTFSLLLPALHVTTKRKEMGEGE